MTRRILAAFSALAAGWLLAACGIFDDKSDETKGWSAQKLYAEARQALDTRSYEQAVQYYQKLEARYPYGRFAQQAQMEMAYAYYKDKDPAGAVTAAERFIKNFPEHPNVDYLYYLKGLANFNEDLGIMGYISDQDMTERDPKAARDAFDAFKELVAKYPDSKYAPDAVLRMNYLVNTLAAHEVHVARYYYRRGAYVASANRAQFALKTYPNAPANEEGLALMVKAYNALGMKDLSADAQRVLLKNFPTTQYLTGDGPRRERRWWQIWN